MVAVLVAACRPSGLPPEPPALDAADASADTPAYRPSADVLQRSAFDGVTLAPDEHTGHAGHGAPKADSERDAPRHGGHAGHAR